MRALRYPAIGLAIVLVAIMVTLPVAANDFRYLYEDRHYNPGGDALDGINRSWMIDGQPYGICYDNPLEPLPGWISSAVTDWEAVLPSVEFMLSCGARPVNVHLRTITPRDECGTMGQWVGCAVFRRQRDEVRGVLYSVGADIWYNDVDFPDLSDGDKKALMAHELGHLFGLNEYYHHDEGHTVGWCNPDPPLSVMNAIGCWVDGNPPPVSPTARDTALVDELYSLKPLTQVSGTEIGPDMVFQFWDANVAEAGYQTYAYLFDWVTGTGVMQDAWFVAETAGLWDHYVQTTYAKPATRPGGFYQICAWVFSAEQGLRNWTCSPWRYLPPSDTDGDGYRDRAESGTPLCQNDRNDDSFDDALVDDGCPMRGSTPESGWQCVTSDNEDPSDDAVVNDGCPVETFYSEAGFNIGTDSFDGCGPNAWPADLAQDNMINIIDLTSFVVPAYRLFASPGNTGFSSRWDVDPGAGADSGDWINVGDLTSVVVVAPPMGPYYGQRAFFGPPCTP